MRSPVGFVRCSECRKMHLDSMFLSGCPCGGRKFLRVDYWFPEPAYPWDCPACVHVGDYSDAEGVHSLFVHYRPERGTSFLAWDLVAVYGSSGPDYRSGNADQYRERREFDGRVSPLRVALERAVRMRVPGFGPELLAD